MALGTSLRATIRNIIEKFGNDASLYSYSGVTKTTSDEGGETITDWKTATAIKVISSDHAEVKNLKLPQQEETTGDVVLLIKDNVTVATKDKLTFFSINYQVDEIRKVAIESTVVAQRISVSRM